MRFSSVSSIPRRVSGVALALSLAAATAFVPPAVSAQEQPELADPATSTEAPTAKIEGQATVSDWGPNRDGWNLTVINDTSYDLNANWDVFSNVYCATPVIKARTTDTGTRGKESWMGGPANMDIMYVVIGRGALKIQVSATNFGEIWVSAPAADFMRTSVEKAVTNEPIVVRITNAPS